MTAQIGALRIRPVFSHSSWTRKGKQPVAASRSHGWRQATPSGSGGPIEHCRCRRRPAIDLAQRAARHGVDSPQPLRRLVVRELPLGVLQNGAKRGLARPARQLHDSRHSLAQHGIRNAEDHGLAHQRMAQKDPLDLDRRDVGPAADDDILLAADEPEFVALALPHQVTAVIPAINASTVERNCVDRHLRLRLTAHPDGIAEIISAAQQKYRKGIPRVSSVGGDLATGNASSRSLSLLSDGLEILGHVVTGPGQLSRFSFDRWLARKALCETLNLDAIALFTRADLDTLVGLNDDVAKAWRDFDSIEVDFKAVAKAAKVSVQTVRNRRSDWRRLYKIDIALPHALYLTLVTVSPVVAMDGDARAALSKALSHPQAHISPSFAP
jgi:hypothetical protein